MSSGLAIVIVKKFSIIMKGFYFYTMMISFSILYSGDDDDVKPKNFINIKTSIPKNMFQENNMHLVSLVTLHYILCKWSSWLSCQVYQF